MYEASDTMENPPTFTKGDIVWVKLSSYWWPGEVINEEDLPADLLSDFKKPPLVIVKFFDEDSYEYVKNWANIFSYNCNKKNEFIKKGMAGYRSKLAHMAKFPKDIGTAEERTNGNPNILSQPEFLPVKKINYDEIFGTPSPKKTAKGKVSLPSVKKPLAKDSNQPHITHRRFLGNDDYRAYIWIQYPGKDRQWDSDEEEIKKLNEEPEKVHTCSSCSFKTKRLEVMILHTKMHIQGIYVTSKRKPKKSKGAEATDSESDTAETNSPKPKQRKKKEMKPKPTTDVFTNLLEEWDDTDEEMEETKKKAPKAKKKVVEVEKGSSDNEKEENKDEHGHQKNKSSNNVATDGPDESKSSLKITQEDIKNCFDFDEEEEDDDILLPTSTGRKIPRVIPEKPKPSISELMELSEKEDKTGKEKVTGDVGQTKKELESTNSSEHGLDTNKKEILRMSQSFNRALDVDDNIENAFKELMEETELPALDDLTQNLKPEQNFHDARTIKFPDKGGTTLKGGTTPKSGTSKKKFVTSFEDFEAGFKKLEDDGSTKKLEDDKEVKATGSFKPVHNLSDDTRDSSTSKRSDKIAETIENNQKLLDVSKEADKMVESPVNISEVSQSHTNKKSEKASHRENVKEPTLHESIAPEIKGTTSQVVDQVDSTPDTVLRGSKRKTRHSEQREPKEQPVSEEVNKDFLSQEVSIDSRRKSSRRKTKQFVIEEDSEEIIEITNECEEDNFVVSAEETVGQLNEEAKEKLAAMDLEIEALKKSLESTRSELSQDDTSHELLKDVNLDQTEQVTESLTKKVVKNEKSKVKSLKTTNSTVSKKIVETTAETEAIDQKLRASKNVLKDEDLNIGIEKEETKKECKVPAQEIHSKTKRKVSARKSFKEESVPVQESNIKDSLEVAATESEETLEKVFDSVATGVKEHSLLGKKGRSRGHQKDDDIDLKRKELLETSQSNLDGAESKNTEISDKTADKLANSDLSESVTMIHKPKGKSRSGKHHKEPTSTTISTAGKSDDKLKINQIEFEEQKVTEQVQESRGTKLEPVAPEPAPRSRRSQSRTHTKEGDETSEEKTLKQTESKSKQPVKVTLDVETSVETTESPNIVEQVVLSSVDIVEQSIHKPKRGRSKKHMLEEHEIPAVSEIVTKKIATKTKQAEDTSTDLGVSDFIEKNTDTENYDVSSQMPEETTRQTRGSTRKQTKENEYNASVLEIHASKNLESEAKQAEESLHTTTITDALSPSVSAELTPKSRRSRARQDVKTIVEEHKHKDIVLEPKETENLKSEILVTVEQTTVSKNSDLEQIISDSIVTTKTMLSEKQIEKRHKESSFTTVKLQPEQLKESTEDKTVTDVNALKPAIQISADSRSRRSSTRKQTKEEEIPHVEQHIPKKPLEQIGPKDILPDLILPDTKLQVTNNQHFVSEPVHSPTYIEQSDKPCFKIKSPRHRKHSKGETQVQLSLQENSSKVAALEPNEGEATGNAVPETIVKLDESVNTLSELVISPFGVSDHPTPKKRRGRSQKHLKQDEIMEPELNSADIADANLTVSDLKVLPTESQSTAVEATIKQTGDHSTPKTKMSRSRKHAKEKEISPGIEKNVSKTVETKVKLSKGVTENITHPETLVKTSAKKIRADFVSTLSEESFPKTRRGRSRLQTREEEEIARAIEESLKDSVPKSVQVENSAELSITKSAEAEPVLSDSIVKKSDKSSSKKGKSRKYSTDKTHVSTGSEENRIEAVLVSESEHLTESQNTASDLVPPVSISETSPKSIFETKEDKSQCTKNQTLHTLEKISLNAEERNADLEDLAKTESTVLKSFSKQPVNELSDSSVASTKKGRTRKHAKEHILPDNNEAAETCISKQTEEVAAITTSESVLQVAEIKNTVFEKTVSDHEIEKQNSTKLKKGRPRKHAKEKEIMSSTVQKTIFNVSDTKHGQEVSSTLEDEKPVKELVQNQPIILKPVPTDEIFKESASELKIKRSRSQKGTMEQEGSIKEAVSKPDQTDSADALAVQTNKGKDIKPASFELDSKISEEPAFKIRRGRSHKSSKYEEPTKIALEENAIKDTVSEITHTKQTADEIQNSVTLESIGTESVLDMSVESSPKETENKAPKHTKQEQKQDIESIHSDKISEKQSEKNKKGRSRTHSRWDKPKTSDIEEQAFNVSEFAPKEDDITIADVSTVPKVVENFTNNQHARFQDALTDPIKISEESTSRTRRGRSQKYLTEEWSKETLEENTNQHTSTSGHPEKITADIHDHKTTKEQFETPKEQCYDPESSSSQSFLETSEAETLTKRDKTEKHTNVEDETSPGMMEISEKASEADVSSVESNIPKEIEKPTDMLVGIHEIRETGTPKVKKGRPKKHKTEETLLDNANYQADNVPSATQLKPSQSAIFIKEGKSNKTDKSKSNKLEIDNLNRCENDNKLEVSELNQLHSDALIELGDQKSEDLPKNIQHTTETTRPKIKPSDVPVTKFKRRKSKHFTETPVPILETSHKEESNTQIKDLEILHPEPANTVVGKQATQLETCIANQTDEKNTISVELTEASDKSDQQVLPVSTLAQSKLEAEEGQMQVLPEESRETNSADIIHREVDTSDSYKLDHKKMEVSEVNQIESKIAFDAVPENIKHCDDTTPESACLNKSEHEVTSVLESDHMKIEPSKPKLMKHIEKITEKKSQDEKADLATTSTDLSIDNKVKKDIGNQKNEIAVSALSDRVENKDTLLSEATLPSEEGKTNLETVVLSKPVTESVDQAIEDSTCLEHVPKEIVFTNIAEKHEVEPENEVGTSEQLRNQLHDRSTKGKETRPQLEMEIKKTEEGENSLPNIIQEQIEKFTDTTETNIVTQVVTKPINEVYSDDSGVIKLVKDNEHFHKIASSETATTALLIKENIRRPRKYPCDAVSNEKLENMDKCSDSSTVGGKQLSKDVLKKRRDRKSSENINMIIEQENQIDSKSEKNNQVPSLEPRLEDVSRIQQMSNKRRRSSKYSRLASTSSVEQTDVELLHVEKSTKTEIAAIQPVSHTKKSSSQDDTEKVRECTENWEAKTRKSSSSFVVTQKELDSDSATSHKLDESVLEKKNKMRFKKYAMIETDSAIDRALEQEVVSKEPTHQKMGEQDNIVPQCIEQKDLPSEEKKRSVPPKKNRWSRRGSYANKDDDKEHNSTLENQIAQTIADSVTNKEIVVEEQIVESNNDALTDFHTSSIKSESLTDSKENNNSVQTSNLTKINPPEDTTEILENSVVDLNDSEIILPPKKSNRTFNFLNDTFASNSLSFEKKTDNDILSFPSCDDSIMSTSLRNNIEGLIKDIDSFDNSSVADNLQSDVDGEKVSTLTTSKVEEVKSRSIIEFSLTDSRASVKEPVDISKCVPPKKKKIDFPKPDTINLSVNNLLQIDTHKNEGKLVDTIPQPPKKKMQKYFESSQASEKLGKINEIPLMSPLAKKKNFLFHEEEFVQRVTDASQPSGVDQLQETEKKNDSDNILLETTTLHSSNVSSEILLSSLVTKQTEVDVDKFFTLPKKRKKRKSSSHAEHSQKKERRTSTDIDAIDEQNSKSIVRSDHELTLSQSQDEKCLLENAMSLGANESIPSTPVDDKPSILDDHKNEMEVKLEEDDFKFCIQTNLSNLATTTAEELSAIATATLTAIKNEVENSNEVVKMDEIKPIKEEPLVVKEDVIEPKLKPEKTVASTEPIIPTGISVSSEPEFVPISLNPTVMSEKDLADAQVEITKDKVISEKKPTSLGMFSMDFLESTHSSKTASLKVKKEVGSSKMTNTLGTEFTSKAMTKEFDNRPLTAQPKAYALKSELLDILEGNSNSSTNSSGSEQKFKTSFDNYDKKTVVQGMFDFEEAIPSQIVLSNKVNPETVLMDSPKLLERLSMSNDAAQLSKKVVIQSDIKVAEGMPKAVITKMSKPAGVPKPGQKIVIKTSKAQISAMSKPVGNKPIILSEQIIRPANVLKSTKQAVQPQGIKRQYEDIEDVETAFIIPKIAKKSVEEEIISVAPEKQIPKSRNSKSSGKAKILQQTIITPKGEIIQPQTIPSTKTTISAQIQSAQSQSDDTVFDINSMPIVLSDDILTPESIQNMPVVLSENVVSQSKPVSVKTEEKVLPTLAKKVVSNVGTKQQIVFKTTQPGSTSAVLAKHTVKPRILSNAASPTNKLPRPGPTALLATGTSADGKPTKYVLVPSTVTPAVSQVKAVKPPVVKKQPAIQSKIPNIQPNEAPSQIVGNKIMIVTNQHGQQTRVVLTPQQQKAFMQAQPGSKTKAIIKGAIPKALLESAAAGPSGVTQKPALPTVSQGATPTISSHGGLLMTVGKGVKTPVPSKKSTQKTSKPQKTILIKNQLGQTVKKIQGTDDDDLDRQVAEQLQAIKASARLQQANKSPEIINYTNRQIPISSSTGKMTVRRSYSKKVEQVKAKPTVSAPQAQPQKSPETLVPALAPLSPQPRIPQVQSQISPTLPKQQSPKKVDPPAPSPANKVVETTVQNQAAIPTQPEIKTTTSAPSTGAEKPSDRPLTQLVIQDGLGNQTTITEGQILAIPSETVDGQPQSYMLVTLDEMGNITPLNNEALLSLDPSLGLGGDLNNMVLQVDQGHGTVAALKSAEPSVANVPVVSAVEQKRVEERLKPEPPKFPQPTKEPKIAPVEQPKPQEVPLAVEQQIVIGEGVLPGGDAGGQQLIVTGDPIATQKFLESLSDGSTDLANILANAEGGSVLIQADGQQILIKTNTGNPPLLGISENTEGAGNPVFATHKPNQDILAAALANTDVFPPSDPTAVHSSPVKGLPPSQLSPGGVLYPMHVGNVLETSLTLSSPIMTPLEVPSLNSKKIDDEADILNQVPKNVDLPITITDPNISQTVAQQQAISLMELTLPISESTGSADLNSPSYTYSLPALDEPVGIAQKPYNGSMPLLTEDTEVESSSSSQLGKIRVAKGLESSQSDFTSNFGSLPMLPDTIESSREEVVKTTCFGEIGSLPMLTEDVIDDSSSSVVSKPSRLSKHIERDIVDEGLSTLGGEMCSSLSEPPPDMFDLASITVKEEEISSDLSSIPEPEGETLSLHSENSGEIPIQPPIVANLNDLKRSGEEIQEQDEKRQKFD